MSTNRVRRTENRAGHNMFQKIYLKRLNVHRIRTVEQLSYRSNQRQSTFYNDSAPTGITITLTVHDTGANSVPSTFNTVIIIVSAITIYFPYYHYCCFFITVTSNKHSYDFSINH